MSKTHRSPFSNSTKGFPPTRMTSRLSRSLWLPALRRPSRATRGASRGKRSAPFRFRALRPPSTGFGIAGTRCDRLVVDRQERTDGASGGPPCRRSVPRRARRRRLEDAPVLPPVADTGSSPPFRDPDHAPPHRDGDGSVPTSRHVTSLCVGHTSRIHPRSQIGNSGE